MRNFLYLTLNLSSKDGKGHDFCSYIQLHFNVVYTKKRALSRQLRNICVPNVILIYI